MPPAPFRPERRCRTGRLPRALAIPVALLALGACAGHASPGVKLKGFPANLVFGAPSSAAQATPANVLTPAQAPVSPTSAAAGLEPLPPQDFPAPDENPLLAALNAQPASTPAVPCPPAALNAFPDQAAPLTVPDNNRPQVGSYRWKRSGDQKSSATGGVDLPIRGFEQRLVRNVKEVGSSTNAGGTPGDNQPAGSVFQYETVQTDLQSRQVVTTWQVDTEPQSVHETGYQGVGDQAAGGPERGIVIKSIQVNDNSGNAVSTFQPASGILLLPLPVTSGETWQSVAVDPSRQLTYQFTGKTEKRDQVDACGTMIDSWLVTGTMSISGKTAASYTDNWHFATQLGGIPIAEDIKQDDSNGHLALTETIGQEHADQVGQK